MTLGCGSDDGQGTQSPSDVTVDADGNASSDQGEADAQVDAETVSSPDVPTAQDGSSDAPSAQDAEQDVPSAEDTSADIPTLADSSADSTSPPDANEDMTEADTAGPECVENDDCASILTLNDCQVPKCVEGSCVALDTIGCCTENSQCDDGNECTHNVCENNACVFPANDFCNGQVLCTMVGASGTCEIHLASSNISDPHRAVGLQYNLLFNPEEATLDSISCPGTGSCSGLSGALNTSHNVMMNTPEVIAETGKVVNLIVSFTGAPFINDAVYENGAFTGDTYVVTYNFTLLSDGPVQVKIDEVVASSFHDPPKALNWELVDGVLVTTDPNP